MGLSVQIRKDFNFVLDIEKDTRYDAAFKSGVELSLFDITALRFGVGSAPTRFAGGIGFLYSLLEIDYAIYNHQDLGFTHQASLTVNFGGSKGRKMVRESLDDAFKSPSADSMTKTPVFEKLKPGETVNINTAGMLELMRIPYVNQKVAIEIIDYRSKNNGFRSVDELMNIKGIKAKKFEKIRPYIRVE